MIRTFTFQGRLDGKDGQEVCRNIEEQIAKTVRKRLSLLGGRACFDDDVVSLTIRVSGLDRWRIAGEARKIASFLLASQRLHYVRPLFPVFEETEPTARSRTLEQGRVPQAVTGGRRRRTAEPAAPSGQSPQ